MSKKIYAVVMPNGDIYGVPAEVIAENYAKYYEREHGEPYEKNFNAMMEFFDKNEYEFADWAKNNMNWEDVADKAFLIERKDVPIDFQEGWVNGNILFITKMEEV